MIEGLWSQVKEVFYRCSLEAEGLHEGGTGSSITCRPTSSGGGPLSLRGRRRTVLNLHTVGFQALRCVHEADVEDP